MSELLPCPFCGGRASFKPRSFKASCDRCGAHVPNGALTSDEAIATWNTRALPAVQPDADLLEAACVAAHNAYEAAAHEAGWITNTQSRKPWAEVPEANKIAMRAGIGAALALIDNPGKEVMPDDFGVARKRTSHDAAPASLSAGGGALPDGFECLAKVNEYDGSDVSKGSFYWAHVMWQAPNDDEPEGVWMYWPHWVEVMQDPIDFAPLPQKGPTDADV